MDAESLASPPPPRVKPVVPDAAVLLEFMFRLGQAYLACGEQTAKVELRLRRTATAYGMRKVRVVAFPTAVFISLHDSSGERVTLAECESQMVRLDQMADFYALGEAAQTGKLDLQEGLERISAIRRQKPRFGRVGFVFPAHRQELILLQTTAFRSRNDPARSSTSATLLGDSSAAGVVP